MEGDEEQYLDQVDFKQGDVSESCFSYRPAWCEVDGSSAKRYRYDTPVKHKKIASLQPALLKLSNKRESEESVLRRATAFSRDWTRKQQQLEQLLDDANKDTTRSISEFIATVDVERATEKLPTGLVNAGLASNAAGSLFEAVLKDVGNQHNHVMFRVDASECYNLKAALKVIIQRGTKLCDITSEEEDLVDVKERRRLLNYDLQALYNYVKQNGILKCAIFFQNSEALDPQVLAEVVDALLSWRGRIPFVLLFEMAISAELFQEKLSRDTVRQLTGAYFESRSAIDILDVLFRAAVRGDDKQSIWIGPQVSRLLLDRQTEHITSAKGFIAAVKYCYMMHLFHNPLSFIGGDQGGHVLDKEQIRCVTNLPSFKRYIGKFARDSNSDEIRKLMKDSKSFTNGVRTMLSNSQKSLLELQHNLDLLMVINEVTSLRSNLTYSTLYIKALAGELVDSPIIHDLISSVRRLPSNQMLQLLLRLRASPAMLAAQLDEHIASIRDIAGQDNIIRSAYDASRETVRTTVRDHKVVLDKSNEAVDPTAGEYTKVVDQVDLILVSYIARTLIDPRDLCLSELLVYDGKSTFRDVMGGSPRAVLERALSRPHDYLACSCCNVIEGQLAGSQPATALIYQLYLESGTTINMQDLWLAFQAVLGSDHGEGDQSGKEETLALFHRALAELRYLGMLRNNKRKADHLVKLRWKGL